MSPIVRAAIDSVGSFWNKRSGAQRILIAGLAVSVMVAFGAMVYWLNKPDYRVLYARLSQEDAARVVETLKSSKEAYKLEDGGASVLVQAERVYDLRLKLAGEGKLHGQGIGFEVFDEIKVGQTDFVQRINYQRALQGELARTIQEFPEIDKARVHLVLPNKSLFVEERTPPSASIVLTLKSGTKLDPKQLQGIVNLVAMSIEGMDKGKVTITDVSGKLLHQPSSDNSLEGATTTQLGYKQNVEDGLRQRLEQLLTPLIGPGKVIARVNADVDFSQKTTKRESYDPLSQVIRSENRSEESSKGKSALDGGSPDPSYRGDASGSGSSNESNKESRLTNYEINREEQHITSPVGEIARLSVAVAVDGLWVPGPDGKGQVYQARPDEELTRLKALVEKAVGFNSQRGDAIEVTSVSFGAPDPFAEPSLVNNLLEYAQRLGKPFLNGLLIFLFLVMVVRPVVMALLRPRVAEEEIEELAGLPSGEERLALAEATVEDSAIEAQRRFENQRALALQLFESDMDQAMGVVKGWLRQQEAVNVQQ